LLNHPAFKFLRYPALNFSHQIAASVKSPISIWPSRGIDQKEAVMDFFFASMPQAGSSKIAFASNRDGSMQIYVMNGDGSGQTRLTYSGANDDYPRWSPNGAKILFQSDRDNPSTGYMDIYAMNADGSGVTRLTSDPNDDSMATWSPDGSKIVFQSLRNGASYQVYSMNADGSGQGNLTNTSSSDGEPSWSPDGTKIAFASDRNHAGYDSVYVMNNNGSNQQRLTFSANTVDDTQPIWSPNGGKIAFVSTRDSTTETWQETDDDGNVINRSKVHINKEVYVMNSDGSSQTRLTNELANDDSPSWSPDGSKIVFRSDRDRDCCDPSAQVWTMNADGTGQADISNNQIGDYTASWTSGNVNQSPIANAGGSYSGIIAQNAPFNGGSSYDPDGSIVTYSWTFGDGGTGSGMAPTHAYTSAGTYTVTLTVTDNLGAQGSASTTISVSSSSSDQFAQNFLQSGLGRSPYANESNYWTDIMRSAYSQGQASMLLATIEFGMTVFESAEYAGRGRTNQQYVSDLYHSYLMRDPEQCQPNDLSCGPNYWASVCDSIGREAVRNAFEESGEFHNIAMALAASGSPSSAASSLATAQVDPFNQSGNQVQARDCELSLPLLSLRGRAGLDLGLGLSYSSLVWTRSGPYLYFDQDNESISPGFTIGFPTVQWRSFDAQTARNVYLLTAGGHRVELRQLGTSNVYEAGDSSYLQLTDYGNSLTLKTTDGTQIGYGAFANGWQATQIEDRNGNVISIQNDWRGDIQNITDTLGRVITFHYDGNNNLSTITQTWTVNGASQTHTWASFGWGAISMQPSFGVEVVGTHSGEVIPVLTQVGLHDGSRYNFEYTGAGQVNVIRRYTSSDNVQRSYMAYDYTGSDDCPRITNARAWAENWNGINDVPNEVVTYFSDPGDGSHQMTAPDGTIYKEFYGTGWQKGLPTQSEVRSGGVPQKWTTTSYIQDNTGVNYQTNPRVTETNVYDSAGNRRRNTVEYNQGYGLPTHIREYGGADGQTLLRLTTTSYKTDSAYVDRRILGLPYEHIVYDGPTGALLARNVFYYDWGGDYLSTQTPGSNYDSANYPSWFVVGRGDLMAVRRYNCENSTTAYDDNQALWVQINGYDMAGSLVWSQDGGGHRVNISYGDSFSDGNNSRNTFAYPTTLTDADGYQSFTQYNYDFGAHTRVEGPPPNNQPNGIVQTFTYDDARRVKRATVGNTGAYTHYEYGPYYTQSYSSVNTVSENPYASDSYRFQIFDGLGHIVLAGGNNPGSAGGYAAVNTIYNLMGRVVKQSNPTEVLPNLTPYGDDAAGWLYTEQTYDWKGRPRTTTNTDGTQKSATYSACGCAGSEAVTVMDEAGRQHRTTNDVLGRLAKVEELNWDSTVYSTANYAYDALNHLTGINHEGQVRSFAYDGHGRLQTRTTPEQGTTTYAYNADDTTYSVTDARGASSTLNYNNRHLLTGINYNAPYGVAPTPNVSFGYDAAGNRTSMTDGLGSVSYGYNQLSQLTSETRTLPVGSFALTYGYSLAGELTSVTNPWGAQVGYGYDNTGKLTNVSGSGYAGVSNYASGISYRASGSLKSMNYGDQQALSTAYDNRMRPTTWNVSNVLGYNYNYDFYNERTGRVTYAQSIYDPTLDRSYQYDQVGALVISHSGAEARASAFSGQWGIMDGPYSQGYDYDKFGNMTRRYGWGGEVQGGSAGQSSDIFYNYTNNRRNGFSYDPAGNLTNDLAQSYSYDATGQQTTASASGYFLQQGYDGDGLRAQKTEYGATTYYLRSAVLGGQVVAELDGGGSWQRGYVYAGSSLLAVQQGGVNWVHEDPVTKSKRITDIYGNIVSTVELDPWGADTNRSSNAAFQPQSFTSYIRDANGGQDAMARRYSAGGRFSQPDPYGGSYDFSDPQSLNRYAYTKNDPVNFTDPSGLLPNDCVFDEQGRCVIYSGYSPAENSLRAWARYANSRSMIPTGGTQGELHGKGGLGGGTAGKVPQTPTPNVDDLSKRIANFLKKPGCADFIRDLITKTATDKNPADSTDALELFNKIAGPGQKGVVYGDTIQKAYGYSGGTVHGTVGAGTAQIELPTPAPFPVGLSRRGAAEYVNDQGRIDAQVAFHETIHLAGKKGWYDDFALANSVAAMRGVAAPQFSDVRAASEYWNKALANACY
jgi:RHS repeat-associated protein